MTEKPDHPDHEVHLAFHDEVTVDPPVLASDYPHETGREMAAETAATLHTTTSHVEHRLGEHPRMPYERASDYPAETGEELIEHRHHD
jgi:hypothetical protein